jgi:thiamine biosynthesis lipoprotein
LDRSLARELDRSESPDLVEQAHAFATGELSPELAEAPTAPRPPREHDWRDVFAGQDLIYRPFGVRLDSGGIGKGLAADLVAELLRGAPAWMVDCGGDLRIGGTDRRPRAVNVRDPLDRHRIVHQLHVTSGAVATSGVTRRSWDHDGVRSHHLIDPRTGLPAATGVLQVTALAPTGVEAEVLAKMALLAGPERAHAALEHGGVVICENGTVELVPPPAMRRSPLGERRAAKFALPNRRGHA